MEEPIKRPEKIKLTEINPYLTCYLCKGYLIDATTISECLHSFCRSCIIKFLQDNSYCPICEVIINKAKPNLKLDKTLQDIVYKLVPELFLKEMTRRKQYYQQYPQIAARVSPEERGEDTERTIFNPQDCISLSMEYVSADSSPGAIKLLGTKNGLNKNDPLALEENQALMKRYLQCPGMCRIDVLKKFVINKYNVDTSLFHIDILYKRVPLPDHYTLIDIAYIYSWKRNEPMKFFFRITDINKVSERFDYFDSKNSDELIVQLPLKNSRNNASNRRKEQHERNKKKKQDINQANNCDKQKDKVVKSDDGVEEKSECDKKDEVKHNSDKENVNVKKEENGNSESGTSPKRFILKIKKDPEKESSVNNKEDVTSTTDANSAAKPEQSDMKNTVYTSIKFNRTNNMEIITKIKKVSPNEALGLNDHTLKDEKTKPKKKQNEKSLITFKPNYSTNKESLVSKNIPNIPINSQPKSKLVVINETDEKAKFLFNFQLVSKDSIVKKDSPTCTIKRKTPSPAKSSSPKKSKTDKKPVTRIILQTKPKPSNSQQTQGLQSLIENCKIPSSLSITIKDGSDNNKSSPMLPPVKNYIEILKLPDENKQTANNANKLSYSMRMDDSEQKVDEDLAEIAKSLTEKIPMSTTVSQIVGPKPEYPIPVKTNVPLKFNIQPSPVPELTNKILNVPKDKVNSRSPQSFQKIFEESIKKPDSEPEKDTQKPVIESSNEVTSTSNNKRNILEIATQLYKKTKLEQEKSQIDSTTPKSYPKIPIPRLPSQKTIKTPPKNSVFDKPQQTLTNLHSNALGLNYTISVGPNVSPKSNGIGLKKEVEVKSADIPIDPKSTSKISSPRPNTFPRNISPGLGCNSPRNSPKHSPKSSPMIKHMYAPTMDQLLVNTYFPKLPSPKINNLKNSPNCPSSSSISPKPGIASPKLAVSPKPSAVSPKPSAVSPKPSAVSPKPSAVSPKHYTDSPKLSNSTPSPKPSPIAASPKPIPTASPKPSPKTTSTSPKPSAESPKPTSSSNSPLSPNQILERYNIQNLAQLTSSLNFNATNFANNQLAAFQHAMFLKHFEMQNRQNWLSMNQGSLLQYEKYLQNLQNLKTAQNQLLGNIKEN